MVCETTAQIHFAVQRSGECQLFDHELRLAFESGSPPTHRTILPVSASPHFQSRPGKSFPWGRSREPQLCSASSHRMYLAHCRTIQLLRGQEADRGSSPPRKVRTFWDHCDVTSALCSRGPYQTRPAVKPDYLSAPLCKLTRPAVGRFRFSPGRDSRLRDCFCFSL